MSNNYWRKLLEKKWCLAMICWAQRLALLSLSLSLSLTHTHTPAHTSIHHHTPTLSHRNTHTHTMSYSHTHLVLINSSFSHLNVAFCFFAINSSLKEKNVSGESSQGPSWAKFELDRLQTFQSTSIDWHFDFFFKLNWMPKTGPALVKSRWQFS